MRVPRPREREEERPWERSCCHLNLYVELLMFAVQMLAQQVECLGLPNKQAILTRFQEAFRTMWAQNGDHISRIYVGTGTLDGKARVSLYVVREGSFSFGQRVSKSIPHLFLL